VIFDINRSGLGRSPSRWIGNYDDGSDRLMRRLFMRMIDTSVNEQRARLEVDLRRTEEEGKRMGDGKGVDSIQ
jgi:hypothetical protein